VARQMGLAAPEGEPVPDDSALFLPFMAAWPAMRDGYLAWLARYEAEGLGDGGSPHFAKAEERISRTVGRWHLIGTLDRIDHLRTAAGDVTVVLDYKTEPRPRTQD